jgi:predicted RNA-binding protein with PIN domain
MSDRWLVDGMNVIGTRPDGWWRDREGAQERLAARLSEYMHATGEEVAVVFDGRRSERVVRAAGGIEVGFASGRPDAADDEIVARLRGEAVPQTLRVVTSDRGLAERVRDQGTEVVSASAFLRRLEEGPPERGGRILARARRLVARFVPGG